jgi:putative transport protein
LTPTGNSTFLLSVLREQGPSLVLAGALSGAMTNPPALAAASAQAETDLPALTYASIYTVALIFKIVTAQVLGAVLRGS